MAEKDAPERTEAGGAQGPEAAAPKRTPKPRPRPRQKTKSPVAQEIRRTSMSLAMRIAAQGYGDAGASTSRRALKGFIPNSGSADRDINDYNEILRQRGRNLYMGAPVATSAIKTMRTNVIGVGLVPKSTIDARYLGLEKEEAIEWQRAAEREFALWANNRRNCDATCVNNLYGLQQLVFSSWLISGDVFVLVKHVKPNPLTAPIGLRLYVIEADRVASPAGKMTPTMTFTTVELDNGNICHDGVEVDKSGAVVAYHVYNNYPYEYTGTKLESVRIPAWGRRTGLPNVLHIMCSERPEQYRGVSFLAPVIESLRQMERYTEAELMAAVVQSLYTIFIEMEDHSDEYAFNETPPEGEAADEGGGPVRTDPNEVQMGPGTAYLLEPGEKVEMADPSRPNSQYEGFTQKVAEQVGAALEIPVDLLLKSFNASYSASRAALLEAWKSFRMYRQWFIDDFCDPVWELFITEAVARGRLRAPGFDTDPLARRAYLGCEWIGPSQGQLDPTKEISAEILALQHGLTTHQASAIKYNGSSWESNMEQLEYENARLKEASGTDQALADGVSDMPTTQAVRSVEEGGSDGEA